MNPLVWQDPPPSIREIQAAGRARFLDAVAALKERAGEWALITERGNYHSVKGAAQALQHYGCEVAVRGDEVYARWPSEAAS